MINPIHTSYSSSFFFFFNDTATTEIYTLSLHDALPISVRGTHPATVDAYNSFFGTETDLTLDDSGGNLFADVERQVGRSEEHTSELQSHSDLVCRLLLEKKKIRIIP